MSLTVYHIDTLSGDTICIDRDIVTLLPDPECCLLGAQEQYLDSVTWAYQATNNNTNFVGTTVSINGDFWLNYPNYTTVNFTSSEFVFGPNGRIIVPPTITLNIDNCYLHGCSEMWNGIFVNGNLLNPNLNITGSIIEDADTAIHFMHTATGLHLENNIFNKNYVDVYTSGLSNFPQTQNFINNTFDCDNGVATATYTPNGLRIPRNGMRSAIAIKAWAADIAPPPVSISLTVGSNSNNGNKFYNHDFGILTTNINLNANFNTFKNINDNSVNTYSLATPKGTNIQCDNTYAANLNAIIEENTFNNGSTAIDIRNGVNARIQRNNIYTMSNFGIVFLANNNKSFRIMANIIDNASWVGIYGLNNPNSTILIGLDSIFNSSNALFRKGIALDEITSPTAYGYNSLISNNYIHNLQYGITNTSVLEPNIYSNEINIQQTPWGLYSHGIRLFNCGKNHVVGNSIFGNNRDEWFVDGIRIDNGLSGGDIKCNYTVKTGSGVFLRVPPLIMQGLAPMCF